MNTPYSPLTWLALICLGVATFGKAAPGSAQSTEYVINFNDPTHRAKITEDGLEFLDSHGPWAFYEVTDATPRLEFAGTVLPNPGNHTRHFRACGADQYYVRPDEFATAQTAIINFGANVDGASRVVRRSWNDPYTYGMCLENSEPGAGIVTDEPITDMYLEIDPAPPIGAIVALRMYAFGDESDFDDLPHPPELCCEDPNDCNVEEPPGGGGGPDEPPGGGGGPDEPPGGGGGPDEPPGISNRNHGNDVTPNSCQVRIADQATPTSLLGFLAVGWTALIRRRRRAM